MEVLLYFLLVSEPRVTKRSRNRDRLEHQITSSQLYLKWGTSDFRARRPEVLSATLSRKKKSHMRHTRTRKLSVTMVMTKASDSVPPPSATDSSSLAESVVS
ncbi:hypothetical protein EYF80_064648 [Liparis tanakae]|uniref:Uncharacterized protein n=1 Tax=Liparis tanakae TaxID=230148 RepID=A0A4Z2E956_9TELE|nr:hypothetical protein EYF80_064648 [Liparis tanakae]